MEKYHRDDRAVRKFVRKTLTLLVILVAIIVMVFTITQTPVITNRISMKQLENSNDWFVIMSMYQRFANVAGITGNISVVVILGLIGWDGYKLVKILNSEIEHEKEN